MLGLHQGIGFFAHRTHLSPTVLPRWPRCGYFFVDEHCESRISQCTQRRAYRRTFQLFLAERFPVIKIEEQRVKRLCRRLVLGVVVRLFKCWSAW